jgi:uncharacterized protein with PIN domain
MAALSGRIGFWSQLGTRERRLIFALLMVFFFGAAAIAYFYMETQVEELEIEFEEAQAVFDQLHQEARTYVVSMERKEALEGAIKKNDPKIQTAIDKIARKIQVTQYKNNAENASSFDKAITRYDAKRNRRPIVLGEFASESEKRAARKDTPIFELTQPMEFDFVEFPGVLEFLNTVEDAEHLRYVSYLEFHRKFGKPHFVRGKASVAMFIYQPQKGEKEEE